MPISPLNRSYQAPISPPNAPEPKMHFTEMDFEKQVELNTKLFLTYLKNQTPDDKVDTQQMMNTMLTMMTGSQQIKKNKILSDKYQLQKNMHQLTMHQYLGREVEYSGHYLPFQNQPVDIRVTLPQIPDKAYLVVVDQNGKLIQTLPLIQTVEPQSVAWDGMDRLGRRVSPGLYQVFVHGNSLDGQELTTDPSVYLTIDEVEPGRNGGEPVLKSFGMALDSNKIRSTRLSPPSPSIPLNSGEE
jgi:flagellar hook assembly protein FlgD